MIYERGVYPIDQFRTGITALVLRPKIMGLVNHEHQSSPSKEILDSYLHINRFTFPRRKPDRSSEFSKEAGLVGNSAQADKPRVALMLSAPRLDGSRFAAARFPFNDDHFPDCECVIQSVEDFFPDCGEDKIRSDSRFVSILKTTQSVNHLSEIRFHFGLIPGLQNDLRVDAKFDEQSG